MDAPVQKPVAATSSLHFTACRLPGCYLVELPCFRDYRGLFVKSLQRMSTVDACDDAPELSHRTGWPQPRIVPAPTITGKPVALESPKVSSR